MKCLVIGNGGREHALSWKLAQSPIVTHVFVAPGNAGTAQEHKVSNINIDPLSIAELVAFAESEKIELTIVGPEAPLDAGIVDQFYAHGLKIIGPTQAAAQLESSKSFCKNFMQSHGIPTAHAVTFRESDQAKNYLNECRYPVVIKADGLAGGKGVIIANSRIEAENAIDKLFQQPHQSKIMIEDFLIGEEASYIVLCDGDNIVSFPSAQDHKSRDDGDKGPNTGGMGAYSPTPLINPQLEEHILNEVIYPTIGAMAENGTPYRGFLFAGLMISPTGDLNVLEFNCRLGDPETQVILMRMTSDFAELCLDCSEQRLEQTKITWSDDIALGVVLAARGYPDDYPRGDVITGIETDNTRQLKVFHAGTKLNDQNEVVSDGGRVLCVTALGTDRKSAFDLAYTAVDKIQWQNKFFRRDIGYRRSTDLY